MNLMFKQEINLAYILHTCRSYDTNLHNIYICMTSLY